jgi:cyclophilin family peptidyl-prolyl cis-trans isomerase
VLLALSAGILIRTYLANRGQISHEQEWRRFAEEVSFESTMQGFRGASMPELKLPSAAGLERLAKEFGSAEPAVWSKALQVLSLAREKKFAEARAAVDELESRYPAHALASAKLSFGKSDEPQSFPVFLRSRLASLEEWEKQHPSLAANPPLPDGAPRVRIQTSAGALVVGLFAERAPEHAANFLKLCRESYYADTKFHRVVRGFMVQGGDPNTKAGTPETWGQGGPGYKLASELSDLKHFPRVLAAAKNGGESQSSGSQFYLTTAPAHQLDGEHTVFGVLLEGADVLAKIESGTVTGERPNEPVTIQATEVL